MFDESDIIKKLWYKFSSLIVKFVQKWQKNLVSAWTKTPLFVISTEGRNLFLVPMLQRGNAYYMGSHAGAWEPGKNLDFL